MSEKTLHEEVEASPLSAVDDKKVPEKENIIPQAPSTVALTGLQKFLIVLGCSATMIINILSVQSLNIALPTMAKELNISNSNIEWPVSAYSLAFGCLLLVTGRLSDIFGEKLIHLTGLVFFIVFQIAGAVAKTEIQLDLFRALQGMGAALSVPSAIGILAAAFPPTDHYRAIAFACFSAGAPVGSGIGSVVGGIFTQYAKDSWRAIFWFTAGITVLPLVLGIFVIPKNKIVLKDADTRIDWLGCFLSTAGLVLLTFSLSSGETAPQGWKTGYIIGLLVSSIVILSLFVAWQYYLERYSNLKPLMRLGLWTKGLLPVVYVGGFLVWACFTPLLFHVTLYYQDYIGLSPVGTMLRLLPTAITGILVNFVFGLLQARLPGWIMLTIGATGTSIACLLFAVIDTSAVYWTYGFFSMILSVFGADFVFATSVVYVASVANDDEQALAGSIFQVMTQLGTALGLAVTTVAENAAINKAVGEGKNELEALLLGLRASQWAAFAFGALALVLTVTLCRSMPILGIRKKKASNTNEEKGPEGDHPTL